MTSATDDAIQQARAAVVDMLLDKVAEDRFPSSTLMDKVEAMLAPDEIPAYVAVLMSKVREDKLPSISMINRLVNLTG
jgi:hypothetical protein